MGAPLSLRRAARAAEWCALRCMVWCCSCHLLSEMRSLLGGLRQKRAHAVLVARLWCGRFGCVWMCYSTPKHPTANLSLNQSKSLCFSLGSPKRPQTRCSETFLLRLGAGASSPPHLERRGVEDYQPCGTRISVLPGSMADRLSCTTTSSRTAFMASRGRCRASAFTTYFLQRFSSAVNMVVLVAQE